MKTHLYEPHFFCPLRFSIFLVRSPITTKGGSSLNQEGASLHSVGKWDLHLTSVANISIIYTNSIYKELLITSTCHFQDGLCLHTYFLIYCWQVYFKLYLMFSYPSPITPKKTLGTCKNTQRWLLPRSWCSNCTAYGHSPCHSQK